MFWGDTLEVTNLDVTNPTYATFADCTGIGNWFPLFYFCKYNQIEWSSLISTGNEFQIKEPKVSLFYWNKAISPF